MQRRSLLPFAVGLPLGGVAVLAPGSVHEVLEVLVVGQASLLAIVLSVSLLSVQVSSTQYAPLLTRVYREGTFEAIMTRFGVAILTAVGLRTALPLLSGPQRGVGLGIAAGLATWSFLALVDLEERLLAFLNPEPVLDDLVASVSLSRYRAFTDRRREDGEVARNPLLEIFQLATTALDQHDNYGALRAVVALERATETLLSDLADLPPAEQREATAEVHRLFDYWVQIARPTVARGADDVLHAIVDGLRSAGELAVAEADPLVAQHLVTALARVCGHALEGGRLEARYLEAFAVFADGDSETVRVAAEGLADLAAAGADQDAVAPALATLVDAGHGDAVSSALAEVSLEADRRKELGETIAAASDTSFDDVASTAG